MHSNDKIIIEGTSKVILGNFPSIPNFDIAFVKGMIDLISLVEDRSQADKISLVRRIGLKLGMVLYIGKNSIRDFYIALIFFP